MKDFSRVCKFLKLRQLPPPHVWYAVPLFGGCIYGYKGKPTLCKRCTNNIKGYYSTPDAITHRNINAAELLIIRAQRTIYARKNGKR